MNDPMEILVTLKDNPSPRMVDFSELHGLVDSMGSMMLLWNTNSYYVDSVSKTFIVNGGRRTRFSEMENCRIVYRKRNQIQLSMTGDNQGTQCMWIMGLESETGDRIMLEISEDGSGWDWITKL